MPSEERLTIDTPEQVALELPIAGIGSRFLAVAVDTVLQMLLSVAGVLALAFGLGMAAGRSLALLRTFGPALAILFTFCVYWGYFAFFESIWSGRTPGKRMAGIRVIKESGRPINGYEAIGRNVLRAIDFLPVAYGLGVVVMMMNRHSRRIGDYVAGTVVVHDKGTGGLGPGWHESTGGVPSAPLTQVTADELGLIEAYLQRRFDLDPLVRDEMADQIARRLAARIGVTREPDQSPDAFLETVARRVRDAARLR